jgi:hypothetical protein
MNNLERRIQQNKFTWEGGDVVIINKPLTAEQQEVIDAVVAEGEKGIGGKGNDAVTPAIKHRKIILGNVGDWSDIDHHGQQTIIKYCTMFDVDNIPFAWGGVNEKQMAMLEDAVENNIEIDFDSDEWENVLPLESDNGLPIVY